MYRPRSVVRLLTTNTSVQMSTNIKKTHYDVLEITPNATQNEVKTAYYEMTKRYHPDVNQEEGAKEKFSRISEAYEVLGNYESRKLYDRSMFISSTKSRQVRVKEKEDPLMRFYRSHSKVHRRPTHEFHIYNFDEWTRAHYGDTLKKTIKLKKEMREFDIDSIELSRKSRFQSFNINSKFIIIFFLILWLTMLSIPKDYDDIDSSDTIKVRDDELQTKKDIALDNV